MDRAERKAKGEKQKNSARLRVLNNAMAAGNVQVKRFRDPAVSMGA